MIKINPLKYEKCQEQADKIVFLINSGNDLGAYNILMQNSHLVKERYISSFELKSLYDELKLDKQNDKARKLLLMIEKVNPFLLKLIKSGVGMEFAKRIKSGPLERISEKENIEIPEEEQTARIFEEGF